MIPKPDLLFIKEIEEQPEEKELELSSLKELENSEKYKEWLFSSHSSNVLEEFNRDLLDNFSPNVETFIPDNFPKDLSLDTLVRTFLSPEYSPAFVHYALSRAPTNLETIQFRRETLDELLQDRKKVEYLNEICYQLYNIAELIKKRNDIKYGKIFYIGFVENYKDLLKVEVPILQKYVECVKAFEEVLGESTSRGLASVYEYSKKVMESDKFKFLSEQVDNFLNANYIELGIKINALKEVRKAKFLDTELNKLKRSTLRKIVAKSHKRKWKHVLNPTFINWDMSYDKLAAMAFDDLMEDSLEQIKTTTKLIGDIEFYTSGIKFYDTLKENNIPIVKPELIPRENRTHDIKNMRNPMVSLVMEGVVPNSMHADPKNNLYIITGANNGGKTCYVTSIGLMYVLAQSGYHIPAEAAKMSIIDNIHTHFVSPDDIERTGEGRWKNELKRIKPILGRATEYSLCLIDDLGSGTNYKEAKDPILTILYGFHRLGATTFMDTHIHEMANAVEQQDFPRASNLQVEVIKTKKHFGYTYRIIPGKAGKSYAKEVAAEIGLNKDGIDSLLEKRVEKGEIPKDMLR